MLTTLSAIHEELPASVTSSQDSYITRLIKQASRSLETYCDRSFTRARATETISVPIARALPVRLRLPRYPVATVYGVTLEADGTTVDPTSYVLEQSGIAGVLFRATGWGALTWDLASVPLNYGIATSLSTREIRYVVDYDAGYDDASGSPGTPAVPVPADLERACIELVKGWFYTRTRDPFVKSIEVTGVGKTDYWVGGLPGADGGLPDSITDLVDVYRRMVLA